MSQACIGKSVAHAIRLDCEQGRVFVKPVMRMQGISGRQASNSLLTNLVTMATGQVLALQRMV